MTGGAKAPSTPGALCTSLSSSLFFRALRAGRETLYCPAHAGANYVTAEAGFTRCRSQSRVEVAPPGFRGLLRRLRWTRDRARRPRSRRHGGQGCRGIVLTGRPPVAPTKQNCQQPDNEHEQYRAERHQPEDRRAVRETPEKVPHQRQRAIVSLRAARVRTQNARAHGPDQQRNDEEPENQSGPEDDELTAHARLGIERAACPCQQFHVARIPVP